MGSYGELRDRLTVKYGLTLPDRTVQVEPPVELAEVVERAFVVEVPDCDKLFVTGRASCVKETASKRGAMTKVSGRYVGADRPNRNNAMWYTEDLEFGMPSVAGGPVNLLHQETAIVGAITDTKFVYDNVSLGNHLTVDMTLWKFIYPQAVQMIEQASDNKGLFLSMECVAEQVQCASECSASFDYNSWMRDKSSGCEHLANGGVRRLVNPTFLGVGLIYGKSNPAWADADASVVRDAAALGEKESMEKETAEMIVSQIMEWAKRG